MHTCKMKVFLKEAGIIMESEWREQHDSLVSGTAYRCFILFCLQGLKSVGMMGEVIGFRRDPG